jgi:hypothetical protein
VYRGSFGAAEAERLLWRAGFGPRRGEAQALAKLGLQGAVHKLAYPGNEKLIGRPPRDDKGHPLAPADAWGHDHCWWLDRMVRTSRPLTERMTSSGDWFATSNDGVGSQRLMLKQNEMFRSHALGSFRTLLLDVTKDPAMLLWLNGTQNVKGLPNENYAREMMELFTLGADRGAYTEDDVREQARALTGWQNKWKPGVGDYDFHFERSRHDPGSRASSATTAHSTGRTRRSLCLSARRVVRAKLWSCFIAGLPTMRPGRARALYRNGYSAPVVRRSSSIPRSTTGAHGEAAHRLHRGPAAPDGASIHDRLGVDAAT